MSGDNDPKTRQLVTDKSNVLHSDHPVSEQRRDLKASVPRLELREEPKVKTV